MAAYQYQVTYELPTILESAKTPILADLTGGDTDHKLHLLTTDAFFGDAPFWDISRYCRYTINF